MYRKFKKEKFSTYIENFDEISIRKNVPRFYYTNPHLFLSVIMANKDMPIHVCYWHVT